MGYNIDEIYQGSGDHLKSGDIGNTMPTYTITGVDQKTFNNGDVKLIVGFKETEKTLVLNYTNASAIGEMYSPDTDNWINRQIMLFTVPVEFNGQKTMGLRVRAPAAQMNNQQNNNQGQQQNNAGGQQQGNGNNQNNTGQDFNERNPPPMGNNDYNNQSNGR